MLNYLSYVLSILGCSTGEVVYLYGWVVLNAGYGTDVASQPSNHV